MKAITNRIISDAQIDESIEALTNVVNGQIESDNIKYEKITGTTDASAGTAKQFQHRLKSKPTFWLPVLGDVFVDELTDISVDIKSTINSETFEILLVR